ncbi:stage III sporulation protein AD [Clostridia bacterium]|nr:stage III sporulation protein AD [Clostridia bacterium]
MEIVKIAGIGIAAAIAITLLKESKPEIAILIGVAAGIVIFLTVADMLMTIVTTFTELVTKTGAPAAAISAVMKILGVGYLTEFAAGLAEDTGARGLGDKIVFGGKIIILFLALPIIKAVFEIITSLIG